GSTSIPGLPSKDVIDVQVTVGDEQDLERVAGTLASGGWRRASAAVRDHPVPGLPTDASEWHKVLFDEPPGTRPAHVHVRIAGRANARYALLFRDFLRTHPAETTAYAELKRRLAVVAPDSATYADTKDPVCDLIYFAAERWASEVGWTW
ncbi:MAG: GrpB family protein, partial [Actinomycetota bacterium]